MAAALNRRFNLGRPDNDVVRAGVLVHQFDGTEVKSMPWLADEEDLTSDR